jgi:hypothetical protein
MMPHLGLGEGRFWFVAALVGAVGPQGAGTGGAGGHLLAGVAGALQALGLDGCGPAAAFKGLPEPAAVEQWDLVEVAGVGTGHWWLLDWGVNASF